jgi:NADP-dependent 3-hydroxy acid dehydrogenase YdfG
LDRVKAVAWEIAAAGGVAEAAQVDALGEAAVEVHIEAVVKNAGKIDVSFNAAGIPQLSSADRVLCAIAFLNCS